MPTYPANKTYWGGFYNNKKTNGVDDRVYTAEDIRKPYDVIYSDGIKPDADGTAGDSLKVTVTGEMSVTVGRGHAKLGGAWFTNESPYTIILDTATSEDRYDCVLVRNDDSEDVRAPQIYIKSLDRVPTLADLTRTPEIYEVCLAYIRVPAFATSLIASNLVDTRDDGELSNTMSGVGATVIRTYRGTYFTKKAGETVISIATPFKKNRDSLTVVVEGRIFAQGENYTINNDNTITLALGLPIVGTRIDFITQRNVNAAGAETVVQEVAELREEMTAVNKTLEHHYYCNGINDNINISALADEWLSGAMDNSSLKLHIHGYFGAVAPVSGSGTSSNPYKWFSISGTYATRKFILDFSDCREVIIPTISGATNVIFSSSNVRIKGLNLTCGDTEVATVVQVFNSTIGIVDCEDCYFWVRSGASGGKLASTGTFKHCFCKMIARTNSIVFEPQTGSFLRVIGGEYYAYASVYGGDIVVVSQTKANSVVILESVNMPSYDESGLNQEYNFNHTAGYLRCRNLLGTLGYNNLTTSTGKIENSIEVDLIETM